MSGHSFLAGQTVVVATKNPGKAKEFEHALQKLGLTAVTLLDYPEIPDIVEDGDTFAANARIKAKTAGDALGVLALADDSGLCVAALDGGPGVYSARYAGEGAGDRANNEKLLQELGQLKQAGAGSEPETLADGSKVLSKAQFVCTLALYNPASGSFIEAEGAVEGLITDRPHGTGGFGYDPLFWLPALGRGMAELTKDEKQQISHRGAALEQLLHKLQG